MISFKGNFLKFAAASEVASIVMAKQLDEGVKKATFFVQGEAKKRTPVDTGRLRSSEHVFFQSSGKNTTGIVETGTPYAVFVHEGTYRMVGRPYMRNAVEDNQDIIEGLIAGDVQIGLIRIYKGV